MKLDETWEISIGKQLVRDVQSGATGLRWGGGGGVGSLSRSVYLNFQQGTYLLLGG